MPWCLARAFVPGHTQPRQSVTAHLGRFTNLILLYYISFIIHLFDLGFLYKGKLLSNNLENQTAVTMYAQVSFTILMCSSLFLFFFCVFFSICLQYSDIICSFISMQTQCWEQVLAELFPRLWCLWSATWHRPAVLICMSMAARLGTFHCTQKASHCGVHREIKNPQPIFILAPSTSPSQCTPHPYWQGRFGTIPRHKCRINPAVCSLSPYRNKGWKEKP